MFLINATDAQDAVVQERGQSSLPDQVSLPKATIESGGLEADSSTSSVSRSSSSPSFLTSHLNYTEQNFQALSVEALPNTQPPVTLASVATDPSVKKITPVGDSAAFVVVSENSITLFSK